VPDPATPDLEAVARNIFTHALDDCSIDRAFARIVRSTATPAGTHLLLQDEPVCNLDRLRQVRIIAAGKAAAAMLASLVERLPLPPGIDLTGILVAPQQPRSLPRDIQFFAGGHPLPNPSSFAAARAALAMVQAVSARPAEEALCIFLLSGGASAMMELPLDPSISLEDTIAFHQALVHCGASIVEINCVRKHFSAVKGGRLAIAAGNAQKITLLVSDVPPQHLDALASGPTTADPTTVAECREIIARYNLLPRFPASVRCFFESPTLPETPKPAVLASRSWKLADSSDLANAARTHAESLGFHTVIDNTCDDWPCETAADYLLDRLRQLRQAHPRLCLISTGEVTVQVPSAASHAYAQGGRNQHFALYTTTRLLPDDAPIAVLSAGSDGIDGNSPAAGAVINHQTAHQTAQQTLAPSASGHIGEPSGEPSRASAAQALAAYDSFPWLDARGATIVTGPTGHNLRDLRILLSGSPLDHRQSAIRDRL
jgi:glycerate 2-kinase